MSTTIRCDSCKRRLRNPAAPNAWNATFKAGRIVGYLCPDCQTPAENAEAEINEATLVYGQTAGGRYFGVPKGTGR